MTGSLTVGMRWPSFMVQLDKAQPQTVTVNASEQEVLDGAGIAFLLSLQRHTIQQKGQFTVQGMKPEFQKLLDSNSLEGLVVEPPPSGKPLFIGLRKKSEQPDKGCSGGFRQTAQRQISKINTK